MMIYRDLTPAQRAEYRRFRRACPRWTIALTMAGVAVAVWCFGYALWLFVQPVR